MKKIIAVLLIIFILSTIIPVSADEYLPPPILLGDIDGDYTITTNDALLILRYVLTGVNSSPHPGFPDGQADINYDGIIDTLDALMLLRIAMGLTTF